MKTLVTRMQRAALAFVLALSLLAALPTQAQETDWASLESSFSSSPAWSFGVRAGLTQTDFYGEAARSAEPGASFTAGAHLTYRLSPTWAFQPEVLFTRRRGEVEHSQIFSNSRDAEYTLGFIEVPLLVKAYLPEQQGPLPYLTVGPYASLRLFEEAKDNNYVLQNIDLDNELSTWDYGLTAGLGMESHAGRRALFFDARYNWGLANLFEGNDHPDFHTRGFTFSVGLGL